MRALLGRGVVAVVLAGFGGAAAQSVHVVGPLGTPGVDFTSLPTATAAAASGDILLILPGNYTGTANVAHKSLAIVGLPDAQGVRPRIATLVVKNTVPGETVLVRGLASSMNASLTLPALLVLNCAGPVLVEDCSFAAPDGSHNGDESLVVNDSSRVIFTRCTLTGGPGDSPLSANPWPGAPALLASASTVTLDACTVTGGDGDDGFAYPSIGAVEAAGKGGPSVAITGTLTVRGSHLSGGIGGDGDDSSVNPVCVGPNNGGAGVQVDGLLRRLDSSFTGGAAGVAAPCGGSAQPGPEIDLLGGSVTDIAGHVAQLELSAVLPEGGSATLALHGTPGDVVLVHHALGASGFWLGGQKATFVPALPYISLNIGALPPSGELSLGIAIPQVLPPGIEGLLVVVQALFVPPVGKGILSTSTASVLVVDAP